MKAAAALLAAAMAASSASAGAPPQSFAVHAEPRPLAELAFEDGDGNARSLADFANRVVLLNLWATWCGPCREEMPTLDRLQAELGGPEFTVVALSIDRAGLDVVRAFFDEIGIESLELYIDATGAATYTLGAVGLPTTLLIDRDGREVGRLVGPASWDAPEMIEFIRDTVAAGDGADPK